MMKVCTCENIDIDLCVHVSLQTMKMIQLKFVAIYFRIDGVGTCHAFIENSHKPK